MPRYDYQCQSCGNEFELRQSFSEAGSGTCPECSGEGPRVFHAVPLSTKDLDSILLTTDVQSSRRRESQREYQQQRFIE
ncbi:MAG: hypothetical protein CM1200mP35_07400 [Chloroflexota bacterium]|nr:MAG: hypothetical protein CM1200mP35_07400 [Chloroflexota bacterium]